MIRVQAAPFDPGRELDEFAPADDRVGGIASFVGTVRGSESGPRLIAMTLEHYPGMTERKLGEIEAEARQRWPLLDCLIIHRYGRLLPREPIVLVATASARRAAAFDACRFIVDWLKTQAPFWKFEETESGSTWVEAKDSDEVAEARWK